MSSPVVAIFFESDAGSTCLGRWFSSSLKMGLSEPHHVLLQKSFGTIAVVVEGARSEVVHILIDGRPARVSRLGGVLVCRLALSNDIETHRIAFVQVPDLACTVDVAVVHQQQVSIAGSEHSVSKWTREDFRREFERFRPVLGQHQQTSPDNTSRGLKFGTSSELNFAIVQIVANLSHLVASLKTSELLADFSKLTTAGIDREGVLAYLKQDCRRLVKDEGGSILIGAYRYTTDVDIRVMGRSARADMASVATLLEHNGQLLQRSSAPAVAAVMLRYMADDMRHRFSSRNAATAAEVDSVLDRRMHSPVGGELQSQLRLLIACAQERAVRDSREQGLLWLQQSIRDFDLFQSAAHFLVACAFGFDASAALTNGVLRSKGVAVLNGNRAGSLDDFFAVTAGWRRSSIQPSGYRPDIVVMLEGKLPVILDAKFSISWTEQLLLPSGPMKEMQAYLDEFDLPGAVLIVPKVISEVLTVAGQVNVTGTTRSGRKRLLIAVPMQDPSSHAAQQALKSAVDKIAALP